MKNLLSHINRNLEVIVSVYVLEKHTYLYLYIYGVHFVHGYSYLNVLYISFLELM